MMDSIQTAANVGMPSDVIDGARQYLSRLQNVMNASPVDREAGASMSRDCVMS